VRKTTEILTKNKHDRSAAIHPEDVLDGIARGERAFAEGRVTAHPQARKRLGRWGGSFR
jgi:hypothetical protein